MIITLDMYQSTGLAALFLLIGQCLVRRIRILSAYCIPGPVVGGLVFAFLHLILRQCGIAEFSFDTNIQEFFMMIFFTTVGLMADFSILKNGGRKIVVLTLLVALTCVLQNATSMGLATLFGLDPKLGLCCGSVSMLGGHGTSAAFGPLLESKGVSGATVVAIASATFGLIAGCLIGGPLASRRIRLGRLRCSDAPLCAEGGKGTDSLDAQGLIKASIIIFICMAIGSVASMFLERIMTFPKYIGSLLVGTIVVNLLPRDRRCKKEVNAIGTVSLMIFLSLAMLGLRLWELANLALPMMAMLAAQTGLVACLAYFSIFRYLGRDYDSAVMTAGFCGFAMGATPNAMANMESICSKHGYSEIAFLVVPLVGALFCDIINASIITALINLF